MLTYYFRSKVASQLGKQSIESEKIHCFDLIKFIKLELSLMKKRRVTIKSLALIINALLRAYAASTSARSSFADSAGESAP
jgi:hypothetical protein